MSTVTSADAGGPYPDGTLPYEGDATASDVVRTRFRFGLPLEGYRSPTTDSEQQKKDIDDMLAGLDEVQNLCEQSLAGAEPEIPPNTPGKS